MGSARSFGIAGLLVVILAACGSDAAPSGICDSSKCFPGNTCLPLNGVIECRKTCSSNDDPSTSCPFNYNCVAVDAALPPFCVATTALTNERVPIVKGEGQWGAPCVATNGAENPACDQAQSFFCYGASPTDGDAYCTRYDCATDLDCGPGFACVDVNQTPNVGTARAAFDRNTLRLCKKRQYCSPCAADVDCPQVQGTRQHCITDTVGRGFCTPECQTNNNCNNEAKCVGAVLTDGNEALVCYPRSTTCVGNGSLCSSCLIDTDCGADGLCVKGQYTTERFCIKPAPDGDCTKCEREIASPKRRISCYTKNDDLAPKGYCMGFYPMAGKLGGDIGCWTPDR